MTERDRSRRDVPSMRDRVRQKMQEEQSRGGSWAVDIPQGKVLELKETAKNQCRKRLDIIPYVTSNNPEAAKGEIWWKRSYGVHDNVGLENKRRLCLQTTFGKACPICEHQAEMYKNAKTEEEKKAAKALYRKHRDLFNVIDLDNEDKGIQVLDISFHLFRKQLSEELDAVMDYKYDCFPDLKGGYTLNCRFSKESFGDRDYFELKRVDFEERENYKAEILDEAIDLDSLLRPLTYEQLEKELLGVENDDQKAEEEEPMKRESHRESRKEENPVPERMTRRSEPKPEPEKEQERPVRGKKETTTSKNECPHGYEFGIDTDLRNECGQCEKLEDCGDEYDRRRKKR